MKVLPSLCIRCLSVSRKTHFAFSKSVDTVLVMNLETKWTVLKMIVRHPVGEIRLTAIVPYAENYVFSFPALRVDRLVLSPALMNLSFIVSLHICMRDLLPIIYDEFKGFEAFVLV